VCPAGLLAELRAVCAEDKRDFTVQSDGACGVLILSKGHFRGIWRCSDGQYVFTPGGYGAATYTAASAEEAVHYTLEHVCHARRQGADDRDARSDRPGARVPPTQPARPSSSPTRSPK
jgi:hypothetical protein